MKRKQLFFIFTLALLTVAAILVLTDSKGTLSNSEKEFAISDTAAVYKLFLADKYGNSVELDRVNSSNWLVDGMYEVHPQMINTLLETMYRIRVKYPVSERARETALKRLAVNSVKVEVYQEYYWIDFKGIRLFKRRGITKTYYVGGATADNLGTFMLLKGAENPQVVDIPGFRGYVASRYSTLDYKWRKHAIFKQRLSEIAEVKLEFFEDPTMSYTISNREGKLDIIPLQLEKAPVVDTLKMINYLSSFGNVNFEAFLTNLLPEVKDSVFNSTPFHVITLIDKNGDTTKLTTYHKYSKYGEMSLDRKQLLYDADRFYGVINDEDYVLLQFFTFDKLLRKLNYFAIQPN